MRQFYRRLKQVTKERQLTWYVTKDGRIRVNVKLEFRTIGCCPISVLGKPPREDWRFTRVKEEIKLVEYRTSVATAADTREKFIHSHAVRRTRRALLRVLGLEEPSNV